MRCFSLLFYHPPSLFSSFGSFQSIVKSWISSSNQDLVCLEMSLNGEGQRVSWTRPAKTTNLTFAERSEFTKCCNVILVGPPGHPRRELKPLNNRVVFPPAFCRIRIQTQKWLGALSRVTQVINGFKPRTWSCQDPQIDQWGQDSYFGWWEIMVDR